MTDHGEMGVGWSAMMIGLGIWIGGCVATILFAIFYFTSCVP